MSSAYGVAVFQSQTVAADPTPSQASQFPHLIHVAAKIPDLPPTPCGSGLARDGVRKNASTLKTDPIDTPQVPANPAAVARRSAKPTAR